MNSSRPEDGEVVRQFLKAGRLEPRRCSEFELARRAEMNAAAEMAATHVQLSCLLALAVPGWVARFAVERRSLEWLAQEAERCSVWVEKADLLLSERKSKKGQATDAFNGLARGIAACSFYPGGLTVLGQHFESKPEWLERKP